MKASDALAMGVKPDAMHTLMNSIDGAAKVENFSNITV
jgi:hypothetical protein